MIAEKVYKLRVLLTDGSKVFELSPSRTSTKGVVLAVRETYWNPKTRKEIPWQYQDYPKSHKNFI